MKLRDQIAMARRNLKRAKGQNSINSDFDCHWLICCDLCVDDYLHCK